MEHSENKLWLSILDPDIEIDNNESLDLNTIDDFDDGLSNY